LIPVEALTSIYLIILEFPVYSYFLFNLNIDIQVREHILRVQIFTSDIISVVRAFQERLGNGELQAERQARTALEGMTEEAGGWMR
jgi:hypothetical protein